MSNVTAPATPTLLEDLVSIAHAMVDIYEQKFERLDTRLAMARLSKRARDVLGRGCPDVKPDEPCRAADVELAENDVCPRCGGELDTGWECNSCKFDARYLIERSDAPSRAWLRKMADGEDAAGGSVSVGGMACDLGEKMPPENSPLVQVAHWEMAEEPQTEREKRTENPTRYWLGKLTSADRETYLDELVFRPEHFAPGTVVIVLEPRH